MTNSRWAFHLIVATALAACATPQGPEAVDTRQKPVMNMAQMCSMHEMMTTGTTAQEQQTMIEQHLKAMHGNVTPDMVARHRQAMEQNCPVKGEAAK